MPIEIKETRDISQKAIVELYEANRWSSAEKPEQLFKALMNSHSLITAWDNETCMSLPLTNRDEKLVGLGNALSDGYLVVYYPHLIVHPDYHGRGIGKQILHKLKEKYGEFHQQILVADGDAVNFYEKCGFERAGETKPMWIYKGDDH